MARVWDMESGQPLFTLEGHTGAVNVVVVTSDGQRIITGSADGTARIWDTISGRELLTLKGHTGRIRSLALTRDGRIGTAAEDGRVKIWQGASPRQSAQWARQEQDAARRLAMWRRPVTKEPSFIQDWLVLAPLKLKPGETMAQALDRPQFQGEASLQPRAEDWDAVDGHEICWKAFRGKEPILDFNHFVGEQCDNSVAYAVCYVVSPAERNDVLLQVCSDDQAKVYLNGQQICHATRSMGALEPIGPVRLRKGTNVLALKVVNQWFDWFTCARFVDAEDNAIPGLQVRLTPEEGL
jgi:WD40 repeat protein